MSRVIPAGSATCPMQPHLRKAAFFCYEFYLLVCTQASFMEQGAMGSLSVPHVRLDMADRRRHTNYELLHPFDGLHRF